MVTTAYFIVFHYLALTRGTFRKYSLKLYKDRKKQNTKRMLSSFCPVFLAISKLININKVNYSEYID